MVLLLEKADFLKLDLLKLPLEPLQLLKLELDLLLLELLRIQLLHLDGLLLELVIELDFKHLMVRVQILQIRIELI